MDGCNFIEMELFTFDFSTNVQFHLSMLHYSLISFEMVLAVISLRNVQFENVKEIYFASFISEVSIGYFILV